MTDTLCACVQQLLTPWTPGANGNARSLFWKIQNYKHVLNEHINKIKDNFGPGEIKVRSLHNQTLVCDDLMLSGELGAADQET